MFVCFADLFIYYLFVGGEEVAPGCTAASSGRPPVAFHREVISHDIILYYIILHYSTVQYSRVQCSVV